MIVGDQEFYDRQTKLIQSIGSGLIALTPDHWHAAALEVSVSIEADGTQGMAHVVSSPEGHREPVMPGIELFEQTRQLYLLFVQYEQPWKTLSYRVQRDARSEWQLKVSYTYAPQPIS
jgi:hypothetical protein